MAGTPIPVGAGPEVPNIPSYASALLGELPSAAKPSSAVSFTGTPSIPTPRFNPIDLPARKYSHQDGFPVIHFTPQEFSAGAKLFQHSLVAKFTVGRPSISEIREVFKRNWNIEGRATISDIWDSRHLIIILDSEVDVKKALVCPIRKIGHAFFRLFRYSTDYDHRKESTVTTKWIRLPGLPLPFYNVNFIGGIVNAFADFSDVDARTKACTSLKFARCCVEIDVTQKIPSQVKISVFNGQEFWQNIEVEGSLDYCDHCLIHGHTSKVCRKVLGTNSLAQQSLGNNVPQNAQVHPVDNVSHPILTTSQTNSTHWKVVAPRRRKSKKKKLGANSNVEPLVEQDIGIDGTTQVINSIASTNDSMEKAMGSEVLNHVKTMGSTDMESVGVDMCAHVKTSTTIAKESLEKSMGSTDSHDLESVGVEMCAHVNSMVPSNMEKVATMTPTNIEKATPTRSKASAGLMSPSITVPPTPSHVITKHGTSGTSPYAMPPSTSHVISKHGTPSPSPSHDAVLDPAASDIPRNIRGVVSSPTNQMTCSHGPIVPLNNSTSVPPCDNSDGILVSPVGQSKTVPCDSLELLRKKTGRHKLAYDVDHKIDSYGKLLFGYDENGHSEYLNARDFYQRLKATDMDDANIFQIMDEFIVLLLEQEEGSSSPIETEEDPFDLSRILNQPRQKAKGSRHSGRLGPKKKVSAHE